MKKYVTKYKFEYFFGERYMIYVRFPSTMTVREIAEELFWAKTWKVEDLYDTVTVRAIVKPQYVKKFMDQNKSRLLKFKVDEKFGQFIYVQTEENSETVYEM